MAYDLQLDEYGNVTNATDASGNAWSYAYGPNSVLLGETWTMGGTRSVASVENGLTRSVAPYVNVLSRSVDSFQRPMGYSFAVDGVAKGGIGYAYDAENRLTSVTSASETNGAIRVLNAYDHTLVKICRIEEYVV